MKKILFLIRSLDIGGAERQVVTLATGLLWKGCDVKVVVFKTGGMLEPELRKNNIPILDLGRRGYKDLPAVFLKLRTILIDERPDILYSFLPASNIWSGLMKIHMPRLTVAWGIRASMDFFRKGLWARLNRVIETWLSQKVNRIFANSHAGKLYIQERGYPKSRITVIPNGIDLERFQPTPNASLRAQWGISPSYKLIGMVGRLDPIKNHLLFLQAVSLLRQSHKDLRFVCVGGAEKHHEEELKRKAQELGLGDRLIWAGELADMTAVYNSLDILVLPSSSEGFPNVVAEAMACGAPCVVTDVGDAAMIVGGAGVVVLPNDPAALKDGILSMLQRLSEDSSLKHRVRQRIVENFSMDLLVGRTLQALEDLLENKG